VIDEKKLWQLLKNDPEEFARKPLDAASMHAEWISFVPSKLVFFYDRDAISSCKQKRWEQGSLVRQGHGCAFLSELIVAQRGDDVACHIGPLYAKIFCHACRKHEVHSALGAVIVHDLHLPMAISRKMATLMECKACSSAKVAIFSDYDDGRDYCLQCDDLIQIDGEAKTLNDWIGLHGFVGFYVVRSGDL
jgi:hypothetical protein